MGRSSLVFASLALSAASAHASSEPVCSCGTAPVILPAAGARDVPRNTKIWVVGGAIGQSRLESKGASWAVDGTYVMQDGPTVYRFDLEQGPTVIVRSTADEAGGEARDEARDEARIDVTFEALARALRHAVPTSIAKRS
jgi:hypothetical protein